MSQSRSRRQQRFLPSCEPLEARNLPALSIVNTGSMLVIKGDGEADQVAITDDGYGHVSVYAGEGGELLGEYSGITKIRVRLRGGDDELAYRRQIVFFPMVHPSPKPQPLLIRADLGAGNDQASFDFREGLSNSRVTLVVHGRSGDDAMHLQVGDMHRGKLTMGALMGIGNDSFAAALTGDWTHKSKVALAVIGMAGDDYLRVDANASLGSRASLGVSLFGDDGTDAVLMNYNGQNNGLIGVYLGGGEGNDTVGGEWSFESGSTGSAYLGAFGDGGDDTLGLLVGGDEDLSGKSFQLHGGDGFDRGLATPNVEQFGIEENLDL